MIDAQYYCTVGQLVWDLHLNGDDGYSSLMDRIRAASDYIHHRFGNFIPFLDTRNYNGNDKQYLAIDPFTSIVTLNYYGSPQVYGSQYFMLPENRHWPNGPYTTLWHYLNIWQSYPAQTIQVIGNFGMYEETQDLGFQASQLIGDQVLSVTNGALLSPGMVLLLDTEQELVSGVSATVTALSTLSAAIDNATEVIGVANGSLFYKGEVIQLSTEDCFIRRIVGNNLVVIRGWNGSSKISHNNGDSVSAYRQYQVTRGVHGTVAAAHSNAEVNQYMVPDDVNWLAREIAGLMVKKAATGFSGKQGDATTGETYYYNEFPSQIDKVQANYKIIQI